MEERVGEEWRITKTQNRTNWTLFIENVVREREEKKDDGNRNHGHPHP